MINRAIPILRVSDTERTARFYCDSLGFEVRFRYRADNALANPSYMGLQRDGVVLHVSSFAGDGAAGGCAILLVDDIDVLHDEFVSRNVPIALPPTDQTWGNREMYVKDADGNTLRFIRE